MSGPVPYTLEELHEAAVELDAELSRSRILLLELPPGPRPETLTELARRTAELEALARAIGLTPCSDPTVRRTTG